MRFRRASFARAAKVFAALGMVGCFAASCGGASPDSGSSRSASTGSTPPVSIPLSTSVLTTAGSWATVPMGHLGQPLDTFWQLFFRAAGSTTWSDQVQATAAATNGGLVLAATPVTGSSSLVVGVLPSDRLTFSPLVSTSDGRAWSNGLLTDGLTQVPDALAAGPGSQMLAAVMHRGSPEILTNGGGLFDWRSVVTESQLASTASGRACGVKGIQGVAYIGGDPVVATGCEHSGVAGIFVGVGGGWRRTAPALGSGRGEVTVLGLQSRGSGMSCLLEVTGSTRSWLAVASTPDGVGWTPPVELALGRREHVASIGAAGNGGFFALISGPSGARRLEVLQSTETSWRTLPSPPRGTTTVSFAPPSPPESLVAGTTELSVWSLDQSIGAWKETQRIQVPIVFGSSQ
jgi:hypothetical protein